VNLEQLKQRIAEQVKEVDGVRLAKVNAVDGIAYARRFSEIPADAPFEQTAEAYAFLLSKSIVDESGAKTLDSDEGRTLLMQLERAKFVQLGEAAIEWNLGDSKKN
jgi:hypothetical protein